jgi:hypothetical protein
MAKRKSLRKAAVTGGAKNPGQVAMAVAHNQAKVAAGGPVPPQQIKDPAAAPMAPEQRRIELSHISYRPSRNVPAITKPIRPTYGPIV